MEFRVKVISNADRNEIIEVDDDFLKVKITASPAKGKANQALIKLLAKEFGVPPSEIIILKGLKARDKVVVIGLT
ncbi:MAG: DUF167 domain-containing protein [Patescibacteria group bacterium]